MCKCGGGHYKCESNLAGKQFFDGDQKSTWVQLKPQWLDSGWFK